MAFLAAVPNAVRLSGIKIANPSIVYVATMIGFLRKIVRNAVPSVTLPVGMFLTKRHRRPSAYLK